MCILYIYKAYYEYIYAYKQMEGNLIMADNEFTQYINDILADYVSTCNVEPFDCQIIISE